MLRLVLGWTGWRTGIRIHCRDRRRQHACLVGQPGGRGGERGGERGLITADDLCDPYAVKAVGSG